MKTLDTFLSESLQWRLKHSRAVLPTGTKLDTENPHKNWLHKDWYGDGKSSGHYTLLSKTGSTKHYIINDKHADGEHFEAHHDQNFRRLGHFHAVKTVAHDKLHELPKGKYPLMAYK